MTVRADKPLSRSEVARLTQLRSLPNLIKIPLFSGLMVLLTWLAWTTPSGLARWASYLGIGYLWMGMVTFMHDATHNTLFRSRPANLVFGIVCMLPLMASFIAFKEDHLEHHRHNRSPKDPDAFTMGKRGVADFILFYAYIVGGALLSFIHFNFIYPVQRFGRKQWTIHLFETALKVVCYWALIAWALRHDVLGKTLEVWLVPVFIFSVFNSIRFLAEHYETPWDEGQLTGSRATISNPVNRFFWNNINWHIGHHVYPAVPWYNLEELHELMRPTIEARGGIVDKSYTSVFLKALLRGPETEERLLAALEKRRNLEARPEPAAG